ncbi:ATP-grasp domain-containing protein [Halosquirtibacter laminarini]|uniref:ATP-grasp domain-containing protein n=1 Tax=Halosquirtibacter laminarini TaxID=3374600 RepID=A0AC61NME8_9BACT|nr:ATP-grasp domain-containing protein [Prolixibacteraceae bacterium]
MNILISSAGRRVSLVRAFMNEMKALGGAVIATDMNPKFSSACQVADRSFEVPRVTSDKFVASLLKICKDNNVSIVIPTIDTELNILADNRERFKAIGVDVIVSSVDIIRQCRDKRKTHQLFSHLGISFAKEFAHDVPEFPLFIKPIDGSCSKDLYFIEKPNDLTQSLIENEKLMFLEYIDPKRYKEFTLDLYFTKDSHLKCVVPRERIEVRSGEINKGVTRRNFLVDYVKERMSLVPGMIGCITLQLFYNEKNNDVVGIEINPRFGGGYPLSYAAGANYPKWIIDEYLNGKSLSSPYYDEWEDNLLMLRYDDEILVKDGGLGF